MSGKPQNDKQPCGHDLRGHSLRAHGVELFGYKQGAFTGAKSTGKQGQFEFVDRGAIFPDKIGETSLQAIFLIIIK